MCAAMWNASPESRPLDQLSAVIGTRTAIDVPLDDETLAILATAAFSIAFMCLTRKSPRQAQAIAWRLAFTLLTFLPSAPASRFIRRRTAFPARDGRSNHPRSLRLATPWAIPTRPTTTPSPTETRPRRSSTGTRCTGRSIASDYAAKLYTLAYSICYDRIQTPRWCASSRPVNSGEDSVAARKRVIGFAQRFVPLLPSHVSIDCDQFLRLCDTVSSATCTA